MIAKRVPSKIVIAGNSKMSLNDRFSSIPKPRSKTTVMKAHPSHIPAPLRKVLARPRTEYVQKIEYIPKAVIRRPRSNFQHRAVPFQSRVTFVSTAPVQRFPSRSHFAQKNHQFQNNFRKPFRPNFHQQQNANRRFINNNNPRFNNGFHDKKTFPAMPKKKSLAELDRELDDYMRKPKHTPITI